MRISSSARQYLVVGRLGRQLGVTNERACRRAAHARRRQPGARLVARHDASNVPVRERHVGQTERAQEPRRRARAALPAPVSARRRDDDRRTRRPRPCDRSAAARRRRFAAPPRSAARAACATSAARSRWTRALSRRRADDARRTTRRCARAPTARRASQTRRCSACRAPPLRAPRHARVCVVVDSTHAQRQTLTNRARQRRDLRARAACQHKVSRREQTQLSTLRWARRLAAVRAAP